MSATKVRARATSVAAGAMLALSLVLSAQRALAQTAATPVYTDTSVISTGAPAVTSTYTAAATGTVDVTLTDLGLVGQTAGIPFATPLASVNLAVTSAGALVNAVTSGSGATPATLSAPGTVSFAATSGTTYEIRVVGVPGSTSPSASGAVAVALSAHTSGAPLAAFSGAFQTPAATLAVNPVYFSPIPFTISQAGNYNVTLTDQAMPVALTALAGFVVQGTTAITAPGSALAAGTTTLNGLTPGNYQLWIYAHADPSLDGGLFGVKIGPVAGGSSVVDESVPVGAVQQAAPPFSNPSAQSLTLVTADLAAPMALGALDVAVTNGSALLGTATQAAPSATLTNAPAGTLQIWQIATPAAGSAGAYTIAVNPPSGAALLATQGTAADPASNLYPYVATATAGTYGALLTDLQFPSALSTASFVVYQAGKSIAQSSSPTASPVSVTAAAGPVVLVVNAVAGSSGGLYYASLAPSSGNALIASTQGVGIKFLTQPVAIAASGSYNFAITDLQWPAAFGVLDVAFTQGGTLVGKSYGSGTIQGVNASAGNYTAIILGVPGTGQTAGLYSISITPAAPTVTLTASPTAVTTGQGSRLTWTATTATGCTGAVSGTAAPSTSAFTGSLAGNGTVSDGPYNTAGTATYTLTCTGPGGTGTATATVTVTAASGGGGVGGGGGGGAFGVIDCALLIVVAALRRAKLNRVA